MMNQIKNLWTRWSTEWRKLHSNHKIVDINLFRNMLWIIKTFALSSKLNVWGVVKFMFMFIIIICLFKNYVHSFMGLQRKSSKLDQLLALWRFRHSFGLPSKAIIALRLIVSDAKEQLITFKICMSEMIKFVEFPLSVNWSYDCFGAMSALKMGQQKKKINWHKEHGSCVVECMS